MFKLGESFKLCKNNRKLLLFVQFNVKQRSTSVENELSSGYVPKDVEEKQIENNYFKQKITSKKPFSMILPPPNITGNLHLGHALTATIQDVIIRWKQMEGTETVWVPGIDHAGIATQVVVEKCLWMENRQTRHDIGREVFQERIWKWKQQKAVLIGEQLRRLSMSLDWSHEVFTMDKKRSKAVTEAFIRLFEAGLIYRSDHIVNWSCILQSAISDIEVENISVDGPTQIFVPGYEESVKFGVLTLFAYKFTDSDGELVVATTRPETILGDVAVAVNPSDDRYAGYIGRNLWHPFRKQSIPVICDDFVDPTFGTGAVKLTPAHDAIDFEVGKRHSLDIIKVIDEKGNLNGEVCGAFSGLQRFKARDLMISELNKLQLLRDVRNHKMTVPICSRSKDVVEFLIKPQWFVKCSEMAREAVRNVREGVLAIEPKQYERTWFNWLENIRDWCISRQLWWGHRIPVFYCHIKDQPDRNVWVAAENQETAATKAALQFSLTNPNKISVKQDEDVLDTWFSSALQPFSAFDWPQQNENFNKYYPLNLMETGHDILFFWVARMVMLGNFLTGKLPFTKILLHGILCDTQGRKMSKSLGNVIAPEDIVTGVTLQQLETELRKNYEAGLLSSKELKCALQGQKTMFPKGIPACGADALRFTLCSHNIKSHFINFDIQECYVNKLFGNKIWQATKFTNMWLKNVSQQQNLPQIEFRNLSLMDKWILSRLTELINITREALDKHNFYIATTALKNFLYYEFCDVYLETTKNGLRDNSKIAAGHCWTLVQCLDIALRVLAPFMPRLAQHLHQHLAKYPGVIKATHFPQQLKYRDEILEKNVAIVLETVIGIRRLKKMFNVTAKHKPEVQIVSELPVYESFNKTIEDLAACHRVTLTSNDKVVIKDTVKDIVGLSTTIYLTVPEELRQALELDLPKLSVKKEKLAKELDKLEKIPMTDNYRFKIKAGKHESHLKKIATLKEKIARIEYIHNFSK